VSEPEIDMFYADLAFLETAGSTATKVKAAIWAWSHLSTAANPMSLNGMREWLVRQGFEVVPRG
jgi:hypothetical protein